MIANEKSFNDHRQLTVNSDAACGIYPLFCVQCLKTSGACWVFGLSTKQFWHFYMALCATDHQHLWQAHFAFGVEVVVHAQHHWQAHFAFGVEVVVHAQHHWQVHFAFGVEVVVHDQPLQLIGGADPEVKGGADLGRFLRQLEKE